MYFIESYLPTLPVFPGVSKVFIKSPGEFQGLFLGIVFNDILNMQRFLDISRFLYSGGWQVCWVIIIKLIIEKELCNLVK